MKTSQQKLYKVLSYLLGYPSASFFEGVVEARNWLTGNPFHEAKELLDSGIEQLLSWDLLELQKHYVTLFDFKETTSLHLTAHEHGDGRERGRALLQLKQILGDAGYEELNGELPDYIPLLLEFLAEESIECDSNELARRLALVVTKIRDRMNSESPYASIFAAATHILSIASKHDSNSNSSIDPISTDQTLASQTSKLHASSVDLEELPYPLYYEH